jgi:hypothetical protein
MGKVHHISTATFKEPSFPGIIGYRPLPLPMNREQIKMLPYDVLVAEIRHYMTIVEQKQEWKRKRNEMLGLKGRKNASLQSRKPNN